MNYLVSIIIPVYKVEKYLNRCIESILLQNRDDLEIILVDDGSPDLCPGICDEYAAKYKNIVTIHKTNGGLSSAIKEGTIAAQGDFIAYVDSDDWLEQGWTNEIFNVIKKYPTVDVIMYGFQRVINDRVIYNTPYTNLKEGYYNEEQCSQLMNEYMKIGGIGPSRWSKVYSRKIISIVMPYYDTNVSIGEDINFSAISVDAMKSAYIIKKTFVNYFINDGAMTQNFKVSYYDDFRRLYDALYKYFGDNDMLSYINYINMRTMVNTTGASNYTKKIDFLKSIFNNETEKEKIKKVNGNMLSLPNKMIRFLMLHSKVRTMLWVAHFYRKLR